MRMYEYVSATGRNYNVVLVVSVLLTIGIDDFVSILMKGARRVVGLSHVL